MTRSVHSNTSWTKSILWLSNCIYFTLLWALRLIYCPVILLHVSLIFCVSTSDLSYVIYYVYVIVNGLVSRFWVVHLILIVWLGSWTMSEKILLARFWIWMNRGLSVCNIWLKRATTLLSLLSRRCNFYNFFVYWRNHCVGFASLI